MQITDRAKDVVKSGGEWISTIEIENIAVGHPKVALAAVVGQPHPKWDERPVLLVKLKEGETAAPQEFIDYLQGKIAKWWMPDDVLIVDDIPLGATGKIDKKLIRKRLADDGYKLPETPLQPSPPAPKPTLAAADGSQPVKIDLLDDDDATLARAFRLGVQGGERKAVMGGGQGDGLGHKLTPQ